MSFSVGSGPMPQPDSAAAPPPATPSTLRNRLRSIPSLISSRPLVVTDRAVPTHIALHVAADAPPHLQGWDLRDLRGPVYGAMTIRARFRACAEHLDVPHVREVHETRKPAHADPLWRFAVAPCLAHLGDFGLMRRRRPSDDLMAAEAGAQRRNPRLARDRRGVVAVHAGDAVLPGVDIVTKEDRLAGTRKVRRVGDDRSPVTRSARCGLGGLSGQGAAAGYGDHQEYSTRGSAPYGRRQGGGLDLNPGMMGQRHSTTTACGREECSAPVECRTSPGSVGTRQQVMFETDDVDESVDRREIGKLHPAPAHAVHQLAVAHGVFHGAPQAVGEDQLLLLAVIQHERAAHARLHRMEKAELAAADLVHPHPLPRDAGEPDLRGHVAPRRGPLAWPLG